jgi:hypothetical protein
MTAKLPLPASQPGYREGTALSARHGPDVRTDGGRVVERSDVLSGRSAAGECLQGAWHPVGRDRGCISVMQEKQKLAGSTSDLPVRVSAAIRHIRYAFYY